MVCSAPGSAGLMVKLNVLQGLSVLLILMFL